MKLGGGLRQSLRSPHSLAIAVRLAIGGVVLTAVCVIWIVAGGQRPGLLTSGAVLTSLFMLLRGDLRPRMVPDLTSVFPRAISSAALGMASAVAIAAIAGTEPAQSSVLVTQFAVLMVGTVTGAVVGVVGLRLLRKMNRLQSRALVIGTSDLARDYAIEIDLRPSHGVEVVGLVGSDQGETSDRVLGTLGALGKLVVEQQVDQLIVMPSEGASHSAELVHALRWAAMQPGLRVFVVPRLYDLGMGSDSVSPDRVRGFPLVPLHRTTNRHVGLLGKRVFDIVVSGAGLLVLSPLLVLVAALVKSASPGEPVFFRQQRIGQGGRTIEILKFRSMTTCATSDEQWMEDAETRVTRVGALLRASSIDEIPQLMNIFRGDMSLVGPRPERPFFVEQFSRDIPGYNDRHRMPVGLTGLSQIVGLRGNTSITERARIDNIYIDQWRFRWDLEIMAKTVWAILRSAKYAEDAAEVEQRLNAVLASEIDTAITSQPERVVVDRVDR